ncbi:hypothetical protein AURDEDRAFT_177449 [Auricularia subglabra TFB-10046 SS5]|uniref:Ubiquitin-like protease family profile domain-containing protein n=1 Tax=Auricularia subglabra (strain TFB-10046 / SS5) TaxID=717982 RepID=J0WMB1_AURST|nr:hypothetical protein AURDEDRAFT_177449 [Auricularia subglabra TFB-10046 SS5]
MDLDAPDSAATPSTPPSAFPGLNHAARLWLDKIAISATATSTATLARRCLTALTTLPSDVRMECFNRNVHLSTTLCLEFLGCSWMRDEHVNAGFDLVAQQLGPTSRVSFMLCWHLDILHGFRYGHDGTRDPFRTYNPSRPRYGDRAICLGYVDRVFVPAHVNGNHWTLFIVDIRQVSISYFDPMHPDALPPADKLSDLRWWLTGLLPGRLWPTVPTPVVAQVQSDGSSCGVVLLSSVASLLLGYPQWTQDTWREHRMEWFLRLTEFWHEDNLLSIEASDSVDENPTPVEEPDMAVLNDSNDPLEFDADKLDIPEETSQFLRL